MSVPHYDVLRHYTAEMPLRNGGKYHNLAQKERISYDTLKGADE